MSYIIFLYKDIQIFFCNRSVLYGITFDTWTTNIIRIINFSVFIAQSLRNTRLSTQPSRFKTMQTIKANYSTTNPLSTILQTLTSHTMAIHEQHFEHQHYTHTIQQRPSQSLQSHVHSRNTNAIQNGSNRATNANSPHTSRN